MATESEPPRNVKIFGRRTSMRLEADYWDALEEIARREESDIDRLLDKVARGPHRGNLSSAIRLFVLGYFRRTSRPARKPSRRRDAQRGPV